MKSVDVPLLCEEFAQIVIEKYGGFVDALLGDEVCLFTKDGTPVTIVIKLETGGY